MVFCCVTFVLLILGIEFIAITFLIVYVGAIAVLFLFVVMMLNIKVLELDETFWKYAPVGLFISSLFILQIFYLVFGFSFEELYFLFDLEKFNLLKKLNFNSNSIFTSLNYSYLNGVYTCEYTFNSSFSSMKFYSVAIYPNTFFAFIDCTSSSYLNYLVLADDFTNTELLGWIVYTYTFFIFVVIGLILLLSMIGSIVLVLNQNINVKRQLIFRQTLRNLKSSVTLKY
jgi:NADH-ubiquinone oxidoreductase chain 6